MHPRFFLANVCSSFGSISPLLHSKLGRGTSIQDENEEAEKRVLPLLANSIVDLLHESE